MSNKKSTFRTLAEAVIFEKLDQAKISLDHLDVRRMGIEELKEVIREAFGKAKKTADIKVQTPTHGWGDAEIENEINWVEKLSLKEFFDADEKGDEDADEKAGDEEKE